jgi:hypothetical protein
MHSNEILALGLGIEPPWRLVAQGLDTEASPNVLHLTVAADRRQSDHHEGRRDQIRPIARRVEHSTHSLRVLGRPNPACQSNRHRLHVDGWDDGCSAKHHKKTIRIRWLRFPLPPPILLLNALSKPGFSRVFALVQRDMAVGLFTDLWAARADFGLSGPFVSDPVACADTMSV